MPDCSGVVTGNIASCPAGGLYCFVAAEGGLEPPCHGLVSAVTLAFGVVR